MLINSQFIKDLATSGITDDQIVEFLARRSLSENLRIIESLKDEVTKNTDDGEFVRGLIEFSSTKELLLDHTKSVLDIWDLKGGIVDRLPQYAHEYVRMK